MMGGLPYFSILQCACFPYLLAVFLKNNINSTILFSKNVYSVSRLLKPLPSMNKYHSLAL